MLELETIALGNYATNCYIVINEKREALIIDPGSEAEKLLSFIAELEVTPTAVLLTHGHFDHVGAVDTVCEKWNIPVYVHPRDEELLSDFHKNASGLSGDGIKVETLASIIQGSELRLAGFEITIYDTPGHTPGGVCYLIEDSLFCGDTLFQGSIGRTDLYGGSFEELMTSIGHLLNNLSNEVRLYPGHGPESSIGWELANNPFITQYL
jgi:glyoxylase-like metal-dependent hydrolase (beta-lactamase superfamily II)